jgi:DNA-directed RNA polymerase specialized sigma24 family protein
MGEKDYVEEILKTWEPKIKALIKRYAFGARDKDLLENELKEKVYDCIKNYRWDYDTSFDTFTNTCLRNHIFIYIRAENRLKHKNLNDALSIDQNNQEAIDPIETIEDESIDTPNDLLFKAFIEELFSGLPEILLDITKLLMEHTDINTSDIAEILQEPEELISGMISEVIKPYLAENLETEKGEEK